MKREKVEKYVGKYFVIKVEDMYLSDLGVVDYGDEGEILKIDGYRMWTNDYLAQKYKTEEVHLAVEISNAISKGKRKSKVVEVTKTTLITKEEEEFSYPV